MPLDNARMTKPAHRARL